MVFHIAGAPGSDKFLPNFLFFLKDKNLLCNHQFYFYGKSIDNTFESYPMVYYGARLGFFYPLNTFKLIRKMHQAQKIVIHGLFNHELIVLLWFMPWLLKKSYWVVWGRDLYKYKARKTNIKSRWKELFRKSVIKKIGHLVTYIKGDYYLAKDWYKAKGDYLEFFMYPSNLFRPIETLVNNTDTVNILVGNSAARSNFHIEVFEKLERFKNDNMKIYVPLSYGNKNYAKIVKSIGEAKFGDKFKPLMNQLPLSEYLELLSNIDVAIFYHDRQQAMGNTINLLGMGKKVFIRRDVTQWSFFEDIGVRIFDIKDLNIEPLNRSISARNYKIISEYFSEENYLYQLKEIFG